MSMAIKYAMKKKAKKETPKERSDEDRDPATRHALEQMDKLIAANRPKEDPRKMAKGGDVKSGNTGGNDTPYYGKNNVQPDVSRGNWGSGARRGTSLAGEHVRGAAMAKENGQHKAHASRIESAKNLHREAIHNIKSDKKDRTNLAEGGCVSCADGTCMEHGGMVDRIMAKRYAKGGEVTADELPNEFDEQELEPAEEFSYTGANSGDELGNEAMDENDRDLISRIMRSRAKKDRMPRPA